MDREVNIRGCVVRYHDATHTYTIDGEVVPSVTTVLVPDRAKYANYPRETRVGTEVHQCIPLILAGLEPPDPPDCEPYTRAYRSWMRAARVEPDDVISTDEIVAHIESPKPYAGTLDVRRRGPIGEWIDDIKCGQPQPWHRLQLAAYAVALHGPVEAAKVNTCNVYLRDDGTYRAVARVGAEVVADIQAWLDLLHGVKN